MRSLTSYFMAFLLFCGCASERIHSQIPELRHRGQKVPLNAILPLTEQRVPLAPDGATQFNAALQIENRCDERQIAYVKHATFIQGPFGEYVYRTLDYDFDASVVYTIESGPLDVDLNVNGSSGGWRNALRTEYIRDKNTGETYLKLIIPPGEYRAIFPCDQTKLCDWPVQTGDYLFVQYSAIIPTGCCARICVDFWKNREKHILAGVGNGPFTNGAGHLEVLGPKLVDWFHLDD